MTLVSLGLLRGFTLFSKFELIDGVERGLTILNLNVTFDEQVSANPSVILHLLASENFEKFVT